MAQIDFVIEHTFDVKPDELTEEEWLNFYAKYMYLKELESKVIAKGILEAANRIAEQINEHRNNPVDY